MLQRHKQQSFKHPVSPCIAAGPLAQAVKLSLKRTVCGVVTSATANSWPSDKPSSVQKKGQTFFRVVLWEMSKQATLNKLYYLLKFCRGLAECVLQWILQTRILKRNIFIEFRDKKRVVTHSQRMGSLPAGTESCSFLLEWWWWPEISFGCNKKKTCNFKMIFEFLSNFFHHITALTGRSSPSSTPKSPVTWQRAGTANPEVLDCTPYSSPVS